MYVNCLLNVKKYGTFQVYPSCTPLACHLKEGRQSWQPKGTPNVKGYMCRAIGTQRACQERWSYYFKPKGTPQVGRHALDAPSAGNSTKILSTITDNESVAFPLHNLKRHL